MKFRNPTQCDGWIDPNYNVVITFGGSQPFNTVACRCPAKHIREEKDCRLRLCEPCARDYDYAHT